jgi:hypothetical protein
MNHDIHWLEAKFVKAEKVLNLDFGLSDNAE